MGNENEIIAVELTAESWKTIRVALMILSDRYGREGKQEQAEQLDGFYDDIFEQTKGSK